MSVFHYTSGIIAESAKIQKGVSFVFSQYAAIGTKHNPVMLQIIEQKIMAAVVVIMLIILCTSILLLVKRYYSSGKIERRVRYYKRRNKRYLINTASMRKIN